MRHLLYTEGERLKAVDMAKECIEKIYEEDNTGRMLYLFTHQLMVLSETNKYQIEEPYRFKVMLRYKYKILKAKAEDSFIYRFLKKL